MIIKKAERKAVKIKLAITGPSGSGKTMGALLLAKGLADDGKVLIIDSEDGSSNLYADHSLVGMDFDVLEIDAPYTITKYLQALEAAQTANYEVIVIDSISHAWAGEGGLLDKKSALDAGGRGNSYTNWASITKEQEAFKAKIIHSPCHVIVTMRSKQEYIVETNDKGKQAPRKVGLAPIQRDGMEYEFTTVFDCGMDHSFQASKDRTGIFDGRIEKITSNTGKEIKDWLSSGRAIPESQPGPAPITRDPDIFLRKNDVAIALQSLLKASDLLSGHELWSELTKHQKAQVWEVLNPELKDWIKGFMENPPSKGV